jgi:uncharacterized protein YukE
MSSDEQVYPIEKSGDIENVQGLSAFQIHVLLLAADPEALYGAARDYLGTAESLDSAAEEIRRGATDIAEAWRGTAASQSQHQLRRYYASARSLATACRASAVAMNHAATALERARIHVGYLQAEFHSCGFASTDPTCKESRSYQRLLGALNSAYRDATAMAPSQVAVSLPDTVPQREERERIHGWKTPNETADGVGAGQYNGRMGVGSMPKLLPSAIPSSPTGHLPRWVWLSWSDLGQAARVVSW